MQLKPIISTYLESSNGNIVLLTIIIIISKKKYLNVFIHLLFPSFPGVSAITTADASTPLDLKDLTM